MPKNDYLSKADLKELLNDRINPEDTSIIIGAYEMAENAEAGETDPTGAPKFYHNTRVCRILIDELSVSAPELLITALLHNILSASSEITISIIDYNFGSYVAYLVQLISDDYAERKGDKAPAINIESIDDDALIIILSDCLDILRTFDFGKLLNPFAYIDEIKKRYFPVALNRNKMEITYLINELRKEFNKILG
jgi:(p)ppGpp synthase/HD superfamily hydrolase